MRFLALDSMILNYESNFSLGLNAFTIQYIFRKFILISEGTTTSNESVPPNLIQLVTSNYFFKTYFLGN